MADFELRRAARAVCETARVTDDVNDVAVHRELIGKLRDALENLNAREPRKRTFDTRDGADLLRKAQQRDEP